MATSSGRVVEKTLLAQTKGSLKAQLEQEGNFVLEIKKAKGFAPILDGGRRRKRIKSKDFLTFNQEFSVLIKAGLPIISAIDGIMEKGEEGELKDVLQEVRDDIAAGESLSGAFGKYPNIFSNLYVASLQAGEKSGNLSLAISRHIEYLKKMAEIKQKIITTSVYPVILTVVSVFAVLFLLIYVVPSFTQTYFEAGTQLPGLTLMLVNISSAIKSNFVYIFFLLVLIIVGVTQLKKTEIGKKYLDRSKLGIPFFGELYLHYSISKLARTLATVLSGGMPLVDSVRMSTGTLTNQYLSLRLEEAITALEQGSGFSEAISNTGSFPSLAVRMIDAGESGGALEQVLNDMAEFYESDVDTKLTVLTSAIEPALMVIMGLLIGFIVLAMYLPIFQMASTV